MNIIKNEKKQKMKHIKKKTNKKKKQITKTNKRKQQKKNKKQKQKTFPLLFIGYICDGWNPYILHMQKRHELN